MATAITLTPRVSIGGSALSATWLAALLELRVESALNVPARVTIRFADAGYTLLQGGTAALESTLQVTDPSGSHVLFQGIITGVGCEQREGEQPELVVTGHDFSYKLGLTSQVKTWSKMSVSTIVTKVTSSSGLSATTGSSLSTTVPYLMQVDTDLGLLGELARRASADWWVTGKTLYVGKPSELTSARKTASLTLGAGLLSFSARAVPAPASVTVTGWDIVHQQSVTGSSTSATSGIVPTSTLGGMATATGTFVTAAVGARSATEASTLSQALFDLRAAAAVQASGTAAGNGTLAPGGKVTVKGAGPLSGSYPVTAVEHLYRPRRGFVTRFRSGDRQPAGLAGGGRSGGNSFTGTSIIGHPGVTAGIVTNIKDPTTIGRVKVRFPGMSSTQESTWARIVAMGGGATRGNVFIPEVTDEVLVAFEDGDTRAPVVIGGLYGSQSKIPAPTLKNGKVQKREFVSRLGHVIRFLDGTSTATKAIEFELADSQLIHFGEDQTTITVKSGNALTITVGSTTITVAKSTGAVTLKAATIQLKGTKQIQLSAPKIVVTATATLTLNGKAKVGVTGSAVQVAAKSMLNLTGSPVSINSG